MRALLVGAGGMGKAWARNIAEFPEVTLAGWVDVRPEAAALAGVETGVTAEVYGTGLTQAIKDAAPDFVVDVTIPEAHHEVTLTALGHGLPVIGEKPMAATMHQAKEMVAAADAAGKLYMVSQARRYNRQLQAYRDFVQESLGGIGILNADFYIGAHFNGFRDEMESPLILDMAIHTFDEARFISGKDPVAVYAEEFNPHWSWYKGDSSATALFEFEDDLRFTFRGSWAAEGLHTSWDGDWRSVGKNGTAIWEHNNVPYAEVVRKSGEFHSEMERVEITPTPGFEFIKGSFAQFLAALKGGPTPDGECHDNIKSLAMVFAVKESSRRRERVLLSELL